MMDKKDKYAIPFSGLSIGNHVFDFTVNKEFFEEYGESSFKEVSAKVKVEFQKLSTMLILHFFIEGKLITFCDRCGDELELIINSKNKLYVKFSEEESDDENILTLPQSEYQVDISDFIYEYFIVNIPSRRVHDKEEDCNKEVIKKLNELKPGEKINPIWAKLKNIK